jgi:putative ABC transport system substrate-binding protein
MNRQSLIRIIMCTVLIIWIIVFIGCRKKDTSTFHFHTIGLVTNNPNGLMNLQGFQDELTRLGYSEGQNVKYFFDGVPTKGAALDSVLEKMVASEVDLIFTAGTPTGVAAKRITAGSEIPVVFGVIADPISAGVLNDLAQPGGNITGVRLSANQARRLELLLSISPDIDKVFVPYNPNDPAPVSAFKQISEIAPKLNIDLVQGFARTDAEAVALLNEIPHEVDAIFMLPDSTINARLSDLVSIALERKLPVSGPSMAQVEGGALTAYGIIHYNAGAQAAHMADQILRGSDPGSLPVETAEFYLGINLQTAELIGLEISHDILQQAEIIIRVDK